MSRALNDDEIAELLSGDVSDIDEFDEGDEINFNNLDEILSVFPKNDEVINIEQQEISNAYHDLLNISDIQHFEIVETDNFVVHEIKKPQWETVPWEEQETTWKGSLPEPPISLLSPLTYFKLFVDDNIISNISNQTNIYSTEKSGKCIGTSAEEIEQFLGIQMYMSIIEMPSYRMFWGEKTRFSTVSNAMSRNRFDSLRSNIHINDNSKVLPRDHPEHDKLFKVRPFINSIRENMNKIKVEEFTAVDEIIIPFKGRSTMKQYNKNKPHKWGIKMFALGSSNGLIHDFEIYVGKGTLPPSEHGLGISGDVVMRLVDCIPKHENYKVSMDNWFNSHNLQCQLKSIGILGIGTVRSNRIAGCVLENDKTMKSKGKGTFDSKVDTSNGIVVTKWFDNKFVHVISNYQGPLPINHVKRWSVADKKKIDIPRPASIAVYNSFMGGIDLHDMLVELYRVNIKVRRFYLRIIYHIIDMCVVNAWILYRRHIKQLNLKEKKSLLNFKMDIAHALLQAGKKQTGKRGRPSLSNTPPTTKKKCFAPRPVDDVRFDQIAHWPLPVTKKQRCKHCIKNYTINTCAKCNVHLCSIPNRLCFIAFHNK